MRSHTDTLTSRSAGLSLLEVMLSSTILTIMIFVVSTLSISGNNAQKYAERLNRATEISQDLMDDIRRELVSSVRIFHNDASGEAYRRLLDMSQSKVSVAGKLPKLEARGVFARDGKPGTGKTGNELMFARHAWSTSVKVTSGASHRVDVYRIVRYYLAPDGGGPRPGSAVGLNLVKWVSEPIADGDQIDGIVSAADRTDVLSHFVNQTPDAEGRVHPRVDVLWLRGGELTDAKTLRHIQSTGTLNDNPRPPRSAPWQIVMDPAHSTNGLLYFRHHSIASNFARSTLGVSRFAAMDLQIGFPHGFEVQLIGPASARQVLTRMVVVSTNRKGHVAHSALQQVIDARDL